MNLKNIIKNLKVISISETTEKEISDIVYDSRKVKKGSVFVCLKGANIDGHNFVGDALNKGASAIVAEKEVSCPGAVLIKVDNARAFLAGMSANFFEHPAKKLVTVGITGTKGKTTTSFMIKCVLENAGIKTGVIGTLGAIVGDKTFELSNTTPESYEIQKYLSLMVKSGCKYAVMEASSIGLKNHRLDGFDFDFGIFTNFSHDHIGENEHGTMEEYLNCKSILFKKCRVGFVNADDSDFTGIIKNHTCEIRTFAVNSKANYMAENINLVKENGSLGVKFDFKGELSLKGVYVPIPGEFNVYNALAASSVCSYIKVSSENIKRGLSVSKVKGRVEPVKVSDDYLLFIDYAHNAVSMQSVLSTLKKYNPARIINMFGAGGNRPKIRRYEMGEVSGKLADLSVITSDNPRFEEPLDIIEDIKTGINKTCGEYIIVPDRKQAIKYCLSIAKKGDVIVLAGKGHEDYQEIKGVKYPMDERVIIFEALKDLQKHN